MSYILFSFENVCKFQYTNAVASKMTTHWEKYKNSCSLAKENYYNWINTSSKNKTKCSRHKNEHTSYSIPLMRLAAFVFNFDKITLSLILASFMAARKNSAERILQEWI